MGILTGPVTFVKFAVKGGQQHKLWRDDHLDALRKFAADTDEANKLSVKAGGVRIGWTAGGNAGDTDFTELKQVYPDHLLFECQVETWKLPSDLLKMYTAIDLRALAANNPSGQPTKAQRKEAKASAAERLREECSKAPNLVKKRKLIPCLWDNVASELLVGATSHTQLDRVSLLFTETFPGTELTLMDAGTMATRHAGDLEHELLSKFVFNQDPPERPKWALLNTPRFLGNEFMLWLWYMSSLDTNHEYDLGDDTKATVLFCGGVKVEDPRGESNGTLNSASAPAMPESRTAIRYGKLPRQAAITIVRAGEHYQFLLQAESFAVTQLKLPKPPADMKATRAKEEHRLQALHDISDILERLYKNFLNLRLAPSAWEYELGSIQRWLRTAGEASAV